MRKSLALGLTVAMTSGLAAFVPAAANAACSTGPCSQGTTVTFSLTSSAQFQIDQASNAAALGSFGLTATGSTVTGALPVTTVTDGRAQLAGAWTVSVSSTTFTNQTTPTAPAISNAGASVTTNLAPLATGNTGATTGGTALVTYTPALSLAASAPLVAAAAVQ